VLFNATQLMMESALLLLLTATFTALLAIVSGDRSRGAAFWLGAMALFAVLVKDTAIPAAMVLAVAFVPAIGVGTWPLLAGVVLGTAGNRLLLWATHAPPRRDFGGLSLFVQSLGDTGRMRQLPAYAAVWLFFLGFSWVMAIWSWRERRDRLSTSLIVVVALSFVGTVFIQLATDPSYPFPRYAYPTLWIGLMASILLVSRSRRAWLAPIVLGTQVPWVTALWPGTFPTINYWPTAITLEAYDNGGTILSGAPVHGWVATSRQALSKLSVYLPRSSAAGAAQAEQWFKDVASHVVFFDERQAAEFQAQGGAKAIFDRRFSVNSCAVDVCAPRQYRFRSCLEQRIRFYSPQLGPVHSRVCLP
jgi:hypothetical protein